MSDTEAPARRGAMDVARLAAEQLSEVTGRTTDAVVGLEAVDDGWHVVVDVIEVERIPPSTSVLGTYEVRTDDAGELVSYERVRRFVRSQPGVE